MFRSMKELFGYDIQATDGEIGKVHDFYFDNERWTTRYLVVDTGPWILGRKVLLAPEALGKPNWVNEIFPVDLTREEIKESPEMETALPISEQNQIALHDYYSWSRYWAVSTPYAPTPIVTPKPMNKAEREAVEHMKQKGRVSSLRSAQEVLGYSIIGKDESLGTVDDFILSDENWGLYYLVLDTSSWLSPGKKTLIATDWIEWIDSREKEIHLDLTQEMIENSPPFDPETPINRSYEEVVYDYYGRPYIWVERETTLQS